MPTKTKTTNRRASSKGRGNTSVAAKRVEMAPKRVAPKRVEVATAKPAQRTKAAPGPGGRRGDLDLEHFRTLLLQERGRLEQEREQVRSHGLEMDGTLPDDGEGGEEDTADLAAAMMDKEMDLSVEDEVEDMLAAVDHALQKMEDGTYGICDISGDPIPESRLELIPWAALTVQCQAVAEGE